MFFLSIYSYVFLRLFSLSKTKFKTGSVSGYRETAKRKLLGRDAELTLEVNAGRKRRRADDHMVFLRSEPYTSTLSDRE